MEPSAGNRFREAELESFANRLEVFARTLDPGERHLLMAALCSMLDPFERMRYRAAADLLTPDEQAFLDSLQAHRPVP